MNNFSIYKKYIFNLISPLRNTRPITIKNQTYIPSPLSFCINADELEKINEIKLLKTYVNVDTDSDSDTEEFILIEYFIDN